MVPYNVRRSIQGPVLAALAFILVALPVRALGTGEPEKSAGRLEVWVSVLPHKFFVEQIGGDRVHVSALVPPGANPHTYEPAPKQVNALAKADVFFRTGLPFEEAFLRKLTGILPDFHVIDLRRGVPERLIEDGHGEAESSAPDGHGEEADPHIWLSPRYSPVQARTILETLERLDPDGKTSYEANFEAFVSEVKSLEAELAATLAPMKGKAVLVYHPAFGYFTDEFGIRQESVEYGGDEPTPKRLRALIDRAGQEGMRTVFIQPEHSKKSAEAIADAVGGRVVVLNGLEEDWFEMLRTIASEMAKAGK